MDLKKIDLDKLQDYACTSRQIAMSEMNSWNSKFIDIKCLDNEDIVPTVKATPIPEGATNGNMFMTMFPNGDLHSKETEGDYWEISHPKKVSYEINYKDLWFDEDWWNAPYESKVEK